MIFPQPDIQVFRQLTGPLFPLGNSHKDISFIQIGHEFGGRDHSTVMKACDKVQKKLEKDLNYRQAIDDIKNKLV